MSRRIVVIAAVGLCVLFLAGQLAFAERGEGGGRARLRQRDSNNEGTHRKGRNLPEWKKRAIQRVHAWAREKIAAVRQDDSLTPAQKRARIQRIRKTARERIRKILQTHRKPRGGNDGGEVE